MKHKIGFNRLDRRTAHRKALKNNMVTSLFRYERVETTKAKALEVKRVAEKLVTRARVDSVHNRRIVGQKIHDQEILAKLFTEIAPRYIERPGGYTRVLKTGFRQGDAAEMVILELVDRKIEEKTRPEKEAPAETETSVAEPKAKSSKADGAVKTAEKKRTVPKTTSKSEAKSSPAGDEAAVAEKPKKASATKAKAKEPAPAPDESGTEEGPISETA
ncbi:MAG TPA: 50S ribosomal protein L17, partial [Spirochaetia bacterium]|nr:50S ribosomal protein L17 [Spirochaetia bacterium]